MRFLSSVVLLTLCLGLVSAGVSVAGQAGQQVTLAQLEAAMKQIQQSFGALNKSVKGNDLATAGAEAKTLATQFTLVERFWTQHKKDDAVKLSATARQGAMDTAAAAAAGDQMKAQMAAGNIGGTCKQCHGLYRDGNAKEGFNIKPDAGITQ